MRSRWLYWLAPMRFRNWLIGRRLCRWCSARLILRIRFYCHDACITVLYFRNSINFSILQPLLSLASEPELIGGCGCASRQVIFRPCDCGSLKSTMGNSPSSSSDPSQLISQKTKSDDRNRRRASSTRRTSGSNNNLLSPPASHRRSRSANASATDIHPPPPPYSEATASKPTDVNRVSTPSSQMANGSRHTHVFDIPPASRNSYLRSPMRQDTAENALEILRKFDTVIIVDDSGSMAGALWTEVR